MIIDLIFRNLVMKRSLRVIAIISAVLAISTAAYAAHSSHSWKKVSEEEGLNGQVICQWQCRAWSNDTHYETTSGYGRCPNKW
jgi:hypothetical protein|tara:strand:- start:394 stop:642 length:249 start_codon:yes stop_codon:yes gene_type:complete